MSLTLKRRILKDLRTKETEDCVGLLKSFVKLFGQLPLYFGSCTIRPYMYLKFRSFD